MAKPSTLPEWATSESAANIEPTTLEKQSGWAVRQKPPAQYLNWWQKLVYQWIQYLDSLTTEAVTWVAKHTFAYGLDVSGSNLGLTASGTQFVRKSGGELWMGTEANDDVVVYRNGVFAMVFADGSTRLNYQRLSQVGDPVSSSDVVTKGFHDAHAGNDYNPHSATPDPTPYRLVTRNPAGTAQFTEPVAASDAATKAYVDGIMAGQVVYVTSGYGWNLNVAARRVGNLVSISMTAVSTGSASFYSLATLPSGSRPMGMLYIPCMVFHASYPGGWYSAWATLNPSGVLAVTQYDDGTALTTMFSPFANDQVCFSPVTFYGV